MTRFDSSVARSVVVVAVFLFTFRVDAALVWGTSAIGELEGSRDSTAGGGVTATDSWDDGGFTISWVITQNLDSTWTYRYTIDTTGGEQDKDISHFILEVTNSEVPLLLLDGTDGPIEGPKTWTEGPGNPDMPNDIYGVKFDFGGNDGLASYTIVTDRAPVYGVFYSKGGRGMIAYSDALSFPDYMSNDGLDELAFIVRPNGDGVHSMPEPSTFVLFSVAAGAGLLRRRRRSP